MIPINSDIALDEAEIGESFIRASGPGGQNVNKVASAVQLRFDIERLAVAVRTGAAALRAARRQTRRRRTAYS